MIEPDEKAIALDELMSDFLGRYHPAENWMSADEYLTSAEIVGMFCAVCALAVNDVYKALRENGFKCVPLPGQTAFVWLLTLN